MSSAVLTIVVGLAGILCSVLAFLMGTRQANRQKAELVMEIQEVRGVLANFVSSVNNSLAPSGDLPAPGKSPVSNEAARGAESEHRPATALLVRASLGALLNERGEVQPQRLFDEMAATLGARSQVETVGVLQHLREIGAVDWSGPDDLSDAQVIRVAAPNAHRHVQVTATASEARKI